MDADPHVNQLVSRLLSQERAERAHALAGEDPSSFGTAQWRGVRKALRTARSQGLLSAADYDELQQQMERWYQAGDDANTDDLVPSALVDRDPTVDMVASTVRPVGPAERVATTEAAAPSPMHPQFIAGATIRDRYVLESQIGNGGTAIVFRARDLRRDPADRDAYVALKVAHEELRDREDITERMKREFHHSHELVHPGIVRAIEIDCEQGTWFLTMELLDGQSLGSLLARHKAARLPQSEALEIIAGCGEALAFAHEHGVLHCDFKPGNVFVTPTRQVRVLDFGVVTQPTDKRTADPLLPGPRVTAATRRYASPDVLDGEPPNERDDVFSLACVSYEVLTGRHPFGRQLIIDARDRGMRIAPAPELSHHHFAAIERGLQWSNRDRTSSVREFLAGLDIPVRKHRYGAALAGRLAAMALGAFLIAAIFFRVGRDPAQTPQSPAPVLRPQPAALETAMTASTVYEVRPGGTHTQAVRDSGAATTESRLAASRGPTNAPATASTASPAQIAARGRVSLEQSTITVDERAVLAVVRVRRLDDLRGSARVQWRANPGSARPGSDYEIDGINVTDIPEGHDVRVIYVPIVRDTRTEGNESFEIELIGVSGRGRLGPVTRTTVTILDDD